MKGLLRYYAAQQQKQINVNYRTGATVKPVTQNIKKQIWMSDNLFSGHPFRIFKKESSF